MTDDQITIGTRVMIQEAQKSAPLNGAIGTVVEIGAYDEAPTYLIALYGATYGPFRAYDLQEAED